MQPGECLLWPHLMCRAGGPGECSGRRVSGFPEVGTGSRLFAPYPLWACRQMLYELAPCLEVISGNWHKEVASYRLSELLPGPFTGSGLHKKTPPLPPVETWNLPLTVRPIGYVKNRYPEPGAVPKNYKELLSRVIIEGDFVEGLYRIEEERKIIIIGYLHQAKEYNLLQRRRGEGELYGVFVCRSPRRPNSISHTVVDLISREGATLTVRGLDLINGTPVLDIKSVYPPGIDLGTGKCST